MSYRSTCNGCHVPGLPCGLCGVTPRIITGVKLVTTITAMFDPTIGGCEPSTAGEVFDSLCDAAQPGELFGQRAVGFALDLLVGTAELRTRNRAGTDHTTEYYAKGA